MWNQMGPFLKKKLTFKIFRQSFCCKLDWGSFIDSVGSLNCLIRALSTEVVL